MVNCALNTHTEILFVETLLLEKHIVTFFLISIPQMFVLLIQNIMLTFDSNESLHLRHEE